MYSAAGDQQFNFTDSVANLKPDNQNPNLHDSESDGRHVDHPTHYHHATSHNYPPSLYSNPNASYPNYNTTASVISFEEVLLVNNSSIWSTSLDPNEGGMMFPANLNAQAGYHNRDDYTIMSGAGEDPPTTFVNIPHSMPFDPDAGAMFPGPSLDAQSGYHGNYAIVTGTGEDPPTTFFNVPPVHPTPFNPDAGAMFPGPSHDAQSGYCGNYAIVTGAGEDLPTTFFNVLSVHPTPFDSGMGAMFPDPNLSAQSGYCGNYAIMTDNGENLPTTFASPSVYPAPFDSHTGNVQVESAPTMTPYAASMSSHYYTSISSYFPEFCVPVLSNDGISMMPNSEDVLPLRMGQPLPLNEPLRFDAPSQLETRYLLENLLEVNPRENGVKVLSSSPSIRVKRESVVNETPFLSEDGRKQQVHSALTTAACAFMKADLANQWILENEPTLYKLLSVPSGNVMSVTRKHARDLVPHGYDLRLPLSSDKSEPKHQARRVKHLIKEPPFPPKYIYKEGGSKPFENDVLRDIVQNTILELGYLPCVTELDRMYCTATAAVHCAMLGLKGGGNDNVEFSVRVLKPEKKKQEKYYEWESWGYYPLETSQPTSPPQMATSQSQSSLSSTGPWPILNHSDCSMPGPSPPTDRSSFGSTSTSRSSAGWTSSTRSSSIASLHPPSTPKTPTPSAQQNAKSAPGPPPTPLSEAEFHHCDDKIWLGSRTFDPKGSLTRLRIKEREWRRYSKSSEWGATKELETRELAQQHKEQFRHEQAKLEQERLLKVGKALGKQDTIKLFEHHRHGGQWDKLQVSGGVLGILIWDHFPWPVFKRPSSPDDDMAPCITAYMLSSLHPTNKSPKDRIKENIK
ncbi:hypothetical protein F4604DRAFT_1683364 [Suillus subluteus]|nr:hypothetical protein F4604DRAFT_1683364 [Suillus subluteus]